MHKIAVAGALMALTWMATSENAAAAGKRIGSVPDAVDVSAVRVTRGKPTYYSARSIIYAPPHHDFYSYRADGPYYPNAAMAYYPENYGPPTNYFLNPAYPSALQGYPLPGYPPFGAWMLPAGVPAF